MREGRRPAPRSKTRATPAAVNRAARDSEPEQEKNLEGKPFPATRPCAADANYRRWETEARRTTKNTRNNANRVATAARSAARAKRCKHNATGFFLKLRIRLHAV
jgi:hypothetical protein